MRRDRFRASSEEVAFGRFGQHASLGFLELGGSSFRIEMQGLPFCDHRFPVDEDLAHRPVRRFEYERPERVTHRAL